MNTDILQGITSSSVTVGPDTFGRAEASGQVSLSE